MILIHYLLQLMKPRINKALYRNITNTDQDMSQPVCVKYNMMDTIMQNIII